MQFGPTGPPGGFRSKKASSTVEIGSLAEDRNLSRKAAALTRLQVEQYHIGRWRLILEHEDICVEA